MIEIDNFLIIESKFIDFVLCSCACVFFFVAFSGSSKVFRLNLSNAKKNPTKKFDPDAQYAFLIHGFTDTYPGQWLIQGEGDITRKMRLKFS